MKDGQNSVRKVVDTTGAIVASYDYTAFGEVLNQDQASGWIFNHRAFGEIYDPNFEMTYLRARWMDPNTGRFTARDPFGGLVSRPATLHRYSYANSSPQLFADPSGQFFLATVLVAVALVGILASSAMAAPSIGNPVGVPYDTRVALTLVLPKNSATWDRSKLVSTMNGATDVWNKPPSPRATFVQERFLEADEQFRVIDTDRGEPSGNPNVWDIAAEYGDDTTLTYIFADQVIDPATNSNGLTVCGAALQPGRAGAVSGEGSCSDGKFLAHEIGHNGGLDHSDPPDSSALMNAVVLNTGLSAPEKASWYLWMKDHNRTR
ncbi:MAG: hypothetical protein IPK07_14240 [Deltaproteobacteria bacterium]|nr:hypothetical protein [Deltaproteobacteria bacterium]